MEKTIKIGGMHCKSCRMLLESELSEIAGVEMVRIAPNANNAIVSMKTDCIAEVIDRVISLGYTAKVIR